MNQNREHQTPAAEAQSLAVDSQNGESTTTPEVECQLSFANLDLHQEGDHQTQQHQDLPHNPPEAQTSASTEYTSDSRSSSPEDKSPAKSQIIRRVKRFQITTRITTVKYITRTEVYTRKGLIYKGHKITIHESQEAVATREEPEERLISESDSGWVTDNEADEGDSPAPGEDNTTTGTDVGTSPFIGA
ncbi:hypothetical protein B0T20DRAFT_509179 [Sordaria brevicollis]|uniref:Uncharacterized protein n=1 Tax=Sordaria brevicollis TaxID=83679 RepID=A0AAE0P8L4_SORBR|nr:hypothetical protein B0T20DRAFT_509179 [Sordaria brevicollis]